MTFGAPSISVPNRLDLRAIQSAVTNARRRIELLEAALTNAQLSIVANAQNGTGSSASNATIAALQAALAALTLRVTALENITFEDELNALPIQSGADLSGYVPVSLHGDAVLMELADIGRAIFDLGAAIAALSFSSSVDPTSMVPVEVGGIAVRVQAGDIAQLLFLASIQSGADASMLVPVSFHGHTLLVSAADIAALGGGAANLQALIDALSAISGAEAYAQIPGTLAGTAYRFNAYDIANLLLTHSPYSSGVDPSALVPMRLPNGQTVLATTEDIAALAGPPTPPAPLLSSLIAYVQLPLFL